MNQIQSGRLSLIPLTLAQLRLLSQDRRLMEASMELQPTTFEISGDEAFFTEFHESLHNYIMPHVEANPVNYEWYTHWLLVETATQLTIGGMGANGLPDENGQVMVGYYIDKKFEGLGYATEAVGAFVKWMFSHPSLKMVVADTPMNHIASQKVLGKNGFTLLGEVEEGYRWLLERGIDN